MPTTVVKKRTVRYNTQGGSPLFLTVTVGDGQAGGITVTFEDLIKDHASGVRKKMTAKNGVYAGKRIVIDATVKDVQTQTDKTSIHVLLETASGDAPALKLPVSEPASEHGGEVVYVITIKLR